MGLLRSVRRQDPSGELVAVSGADPLNLVGILTAGNPLPAVATNHVLYRDGIPIAIQEGEGRGVQLLVEASPEAEQQIRTALVQRRVAPLVRTYLGKTRPRPRPHPRPASLRE